MLKVFVSYRRAESEGWVRGLDAQLAKALGRDNVFCDVQSLLPGTRFEERIRDWVAQAQVMLVVIGSLWTKVVGENGRRRLLDPKDLVRREIELAFAHRLIVVPVLVGDARLPLPEELPPKLRRLVEHSAAMLRPPSFEADVSQLVEQLMEIGRDAPSPTMMVEDGIPARPGSADSPSRVLTPDLPASDSGATEEEPERSAEIVEASAAPGGSCYESWRAALAELPALTIRPGSPLVLAISRESVDGSYRYEVIACREAAEKTQSVTVEIGQSVLELSLRRSELAFAADEVLVHGAMLFRLLVPRSLRAQVVSASMIELRLDATTDRWPWERLVAPGSELPLSASIPIVRRAIDAPPASFQPSHPVVSALTILGDPQDPQIFAQLPAAEIEVTRIADVLRTAGLETACLVRPSAEEALRTLLAGEPDVLHICGHSVEDWLPDNSIGAVTAGERRPLSGVLIGHRVVLTAHEMFCADRLPSLITFGVEYVSAWALTLLDEGAQVVVAFGGSVGDAPAMEFFVEFYEALANGQSAQVAMQLGRLRAAASRDLGGLATATLARMYGDSEYRLTAVQPSDSTRLQARRKLGIGTR
jgi:hypothetical protein